MTLENYLQERKLNNMREATIKNDIKVLKPLNDFKTLDECTEQDIKNFIDYYKKNFELKHKRKPDLNFMYNIIKKYYKNTGKPEIVKWMKTKNVLKPLNQNKLLTSEEVQRMIQVCDKDRDKCIIAMAYDSGMRIGELLSLRIDDIKILENEYKIRIPNNFEADDIDAKTGTRSMILIESFPYIQNYLKVHNGDKKLFDFKKNRADQILKEKAKKAGITKNVYWHLLRHSRATEFVKLGMQETSMKKRFGWTGSSKMIERYTHITDTDADDAYKKALGLATEQKNIIINPIARRCVKCGKLIDTGEYCPQCSEIQRLIKLNEKSQFEKDNLEQTLKNQEAESFIQSHSIAKLIDAVKELQTKITIQEEKHGFQTGLNASAWEEGTGRVIEWKNGVKTVREPTVEDYTPHNPLDDPAPPAITKEQKERATAFDEMEKKVRENAKAKGVVTAAERAQMLLESSPQVRAEAEARGAPGKKERDRKRAEKLIAEREKKDTEQK